MANKENPDFTPSDNQTSGAIKVIATFLEKAGTGKKGAWTVGIAPSGKFSNYYHPNGWPKRLSEAFFFDDFSHMMRYLDKRKIVVDSQCIVRFSYVIAIDMTLVFHKENVINSFNGEMLEEQIDKYLQENYRIDYTTYKRIKYLEINNTEI